MELSESFFLEHLAQTTPFPFLLRIERAEGIYLYSPEGHRYMDLISGIGVSNAGHRHPTVIAAIEEQIKKHLHVMVYGEFVQASPNLLADLLIKHLPPSLSCCYFVNSGTEANEGALKLARRFTRRTELVSCYRSYHGSTMGSMSVSGNELKKSAFRPLIPDVRFIRFDEADDLEQITTRTAGVIVETIQGDAGVRIPSKSWMKALRRRCTETGALLILDEIQCGMGRTGTLFAFEQFDIVPDILTLGKALGGGLPLGAFIASEDLMKVLTVNPMLGHITTFGGNPLSCSAGAASLKVITNPAILQQVDRKGQLFEHQLRHKLIHEFRRIGLMIALDFENEEIAGRFIQEALKEGIICFHFLSNPHSVRLSPPLIINETEIADACVTLHRVLDRIAS